MNEGHQNVLASLIVRAVVQSGSKESFTAITEFVDKQIVEYEKIVLCLNTVQFMIDNSVSENTIEDYIETYALDDIAVLEIAEKESSAYVVEKIHSSIPRG